MLLIDTNDQEIAMDFIMWCGELMGEPNSLTYSQAKNLRAIQLYTHVRFSIVRAEFSFHRHFRTII